MNLRLGNISSLQFFQLARFSTFILIGVLLAKAGFSTAEIGQYETLIFISGAVSFFWLNGLIQGMLASHDNQPKNQFFGVFVVVSVLTVLMIAFLLIFEQTFSHLLLKSDQIPLMTYLCAYLFFSVPANLVEYIYLVKNQPEKIRWYAAISFSVMFVLVALPALLGFPLTHVVIGLLVSAALRYAWLIFILIREGKYQLTSGYINKLLKLSFPLIISALLSGSAQYIDGFIVSSHFDEAAFAVFRYGAREFPLVLLLANAFSVAMIPRFAQEANRAEAILQIKTYSRRLMHALFPASILMLALSHLLFPVVFNTSFTESATIFNIYLILVVSRLMFPQTILIGMKETGIIAWASLLEIVANVGLSLWFVQLWGLAGIAYATVIAYLFEKCFLAFILKTKYKVPVRQYLNISVLLIYSVLLLAVFYLVEFVIY